MSDPMKGRLFEARAIQNNALSLHPIITNCFGQQR